MTDLGTLPGGTWGQALGINASGQVVGTADIPGGQPHAFLYHGGAMVDLTDLLIWDLHWVFYDARGINDAGQIVGDGPGSGVGGQWRRAFLLTSVNPPPTANAGPDQTVQAGALVQLDGSNFAPASDIASYQWAQISGPLVTLSDPTVVRPTFTAPAVGTNGASLQFRLTVTDKGGQTAQDTCTVTVTWVNQPPLANAGPDQTVRAGDPVTLDGSSSADPDDGIASYQWQQLSGKPVTLSNSHAVRPTFTAPHVSYGGETLTFRLTVTDKSGLQSAATCAVNVQWVNTPPVAKAGNNVFILSKDQNATVLTGTASDADGDPLTYRWLEGATELAGGQVGPDGTAPLNLGLISRLSLGAHALTLEVNDGYDISRDSMILTVENSSPTAAPSGDGTYQVRTPVTLSGQVADYDGDTVGYAWLEGATSLSSGTAQTIVGGAPVNLPQFTTSSLEVGVHNVTLQVSDGVNDPVAKTITVKVIDTVTITATDDSGNASTANVKIFVPHDQGKK